MPATAQALLAAVPLATILALMLGLHWSAARAGSVGLAATLLIAWFGFGMGTSTLGGLGVLGAAGGALLEAVFIAGTILWIIFPALCIHELQLRTGAIDILRDAMSRLSGDPRIVALLVAWFFVLFIEGAAGFGTSVALAAPFLVAAGFGRVEAVTIALIGHVAGVSFGAVGTPILAQVAVTPFDGLQLAGATSVYHAVLGALLPLVVMLSVTRALPSSRGQGGAIWWWTLLAAAAFLVPFQLIATFVGPELPTLGGALVGAALFVLALRLAAKRSRDAADPAAPGPRADAPTPRAVAIAAAPYLVLVAAVLATRLLPPLRALLEGWTIDWQIAPFRGTFAPAYHPGTMLLLGFAAGALIRRAPGADVAHALRTAAARLGPVTLALVAMLGLSRLMVHAGMIDALAVAAAAAAGAGWPLFAPLVGALGTFVTGSATASNILFTDFQLATAQELGLDAPALLGAQGFGAAVGNAICPHNVIAAGATVDLVGRESEVLRRTVGVSLAYALLGGALALFVFA